MTICAKVGCPTPTVARSTPRTSALFTGLLMSVFPLFRSQLLPSPPKSPHAHAPLFRQVVDITWLDIECGVPAVDIACRADHAVFRDGVLVGQRCCTQRAIARFDARDLTIGEKETLLAGVAVEYRRGFVLERKVIGFERHRQTRKVCDGFSQHIITDDMQAR